VYAWDSAAQAWLSFTPALPDPMQSLQSLDRTQGFWIRALRNVTLRVQGSAPVQTAIVLNTGWNLIGFPAASAQDLQTALAPVAGRYGLVFEYVANTGWRSYSPAAPPFSNSLNSLRPGYGYWIYATQPSVWVVTY
jgi:hypothetical protein